MLAYFYISFADPNLPRGSQWLGACLVIAPMSDDIRVEMTGVLKTAHVWECNPGGSTQAHRVMIDDATPISPSMGHRRPAVHVGGRVRGRMFVVARGRARRAPGRR